MRNPVPPIPERYVDRYRNDALFRKLVDGMLAALRERTFTALDLQDAALMANHLHERFKFERGL